MEDAVDGRTTDMRERIMDVALELFATDGYTATSLRAIADRLDVTKAALYYHFPRKADLLAALIDPMVEEMDAWFERVTARPGPPREVLTAYFDLVHRHAAVLGILGREPSIIDEHLTEHVGGWIHSAEHLFAGPDATLEQRIRATVAITGLARTTTVFADGPVEVVRREAVEAALGALGPAVGDQDP